MQAHPSKKRHLAKAVTWRLVASTTTFGLAWLFFRNDAYATEKATGLALTEVVIKTLLYYLHERAWYRSGFGFRKTNQDEGDGST